MSLPIPNLDDRGYEELLKDARKKILEDLHTDWNDLSPGDPGMVLLETFAFLTEQMIYRLNRLPEKTYIAFLNMLGVGLKPPYAAKVELSFWQNPDWVYKGKGTVPVPRGTQVATESGGGEPVVFTTVEDTDILPKSISEETAQKVLAYHATWVEKEPLGKGTGLPGQVFTVSQPSILAGVKGLEMRLSVDDETWREVDNFANVGENEKVYRVDRQTGTIYFAPAAFLYKDAKLQTAAEISGGQNGKHSKPDSNEKDNANKKEPLAAVPPEGSLIHVRYPMGGGAGGNISSKLLTVIIQSPELQTNLKVTNLEPARGGVDAETLENALVRGPQEVFTQKRLITARDFERRVLDGYWRSTIARARAYALQELWEHAIPGTVSLSLVPRLDGSGNPTSITKDALEREQARLDKENLKDEIEKALEVESPLGIHDLRPEWARYKTVSIYIEATVPHDGKAKDVENRLSDRLYHAITTPKSEKNPDGQEWEGRDFGAELRWAEVLGWVYESAENNITKLGKLELTLDSAPDRAIASLAADHFQAQTWYATSGERLFRTTNDAAGWEELLNFAPGKSNPSLYLEPGMENPPGGQTLKKVCPSPYKKGLVALTGLAVPEQTTDQPRSCVYLSTDCGEGWLRLTDLDAEIHDMDWQRRAGRHILLLATSKGLKKLHIEFGMERSGQLKPSDPIPDDELMDSLPLKGSSPIPMIDNKSETHPKYVIQGRPRLEVSYPIPVIPHESVALPVYAVKVLKGIGGTACVAVAMGERRGVYLSQDSELKAFSKLEHDNTDRRVRPDIRSLGLQWSERDNRFLLWAGGMALGPQDPGSGCCCWVLDQQLNLILEQSQYLQGEGKGRWCQDGWIGGSCLGLEFLDNRILAATARGSILCADVTPPTRDKPQTISAWHTFDDHDGTLPHKLRFGESTKSAEALAREDHIPFTAIASHDSSQLVLAGCGKGVFRSQDRGQTFEKVSRDTFNQMKDSITIPPNWLLVSGEHKITITEEREADHGAG